MIKDPPVLRVRRTFPRPTADQIDAFQDTPTGFVVDCMNGRGGLNYRIKPLDPRQVTFVGTAVTCHCGPADNLALIAALSVIQPRDVLVVATDSFTATCVTGDLLIGMARNRGCVAFVTDGLLRDTDGIERVGLPTFAAGVTPNSCTRTGPGTVGLPVSLGDVVVESGDVVIGDRDGVVVVPQRRIPAVATKLIEVRAAEANLDEQVRYGVTSPAFLNDLLESDRVEFVDE